MTALALARKWRPKTFSELLGQDHVVKALTHALDQGRLHHAWLFTGTRGVGKTTIARIMAKALNCTGADGYGQMTSAPCGKCQACTEIDAGRFVDYIEMDAASNRGVDEMVALLEKAAYAPSSARFKVYMIDSRRASSPCEVYSCDHRSPKNTSYGFISLFTVQSQADARARDRGALTGRSSIGVSQHRDQCITHHC